MAECEHRWDVDSETEYTFCRRCFQAREKLLEDALRALVEAARRYTGYITPPLDAYDQFQSACSSAERLIGEAKS